MISRTAKCLAVFMVLVGPPVKGADDALVTELQRQVAIAEAKRKIAEDEAAAAKAKLGAIDTTDLPKGSGSATDLKVEGTIMAYRAADAIAEQIAGVLTDPGLRVTQIVFFSEQQLNGILKYRAFIRQANLLQEAIRQVSGDLERPRLPSLESDNCLQPQPRALAGAPLDTINSALQVLTLFKTDKVISGAEVTLEEFAIAAALVQRLRLINPNLAIAYPPSFQPGLFTGGADPFDTSAVFTAFQNLMARDITLAEAQKLFARKVEELKEKIKKASKGCKPLFQQDIELLEGLTARATALQTILTQMQAGLLKLDDATGASTLQSLYVAEVLAARFSNAHVLQLKPVAAGGATMAKTNIFTTRFYFSGGAVIAYMLFRGDTGDVVASGNVGRYSGFAKEGQLDEQGNRKAPPH
jgi:hypothetical protein